MIPVSVAIIQKDGLFLITRRLKASSLGHFWEFPGGKIEGRETPEECIIRECQEEIGVQIATQKRFREVTYHAENESYYLYFLICEIVSGEPTPIECAEIRWVPASELQRFEFPEADLQIIEDLMTSIFHIDRNPQNQ